ncbi:hypothetical protein B296_00058716 [Ensete ventricosum]|uniref:Uncharacterized protein n=1 Tax=Ensete ventricosum TaxID=4639 RepID=A0A426WXB6_ENSVE|nr:hypothetical protein B296_00058716 [Ensete ventricosum]
MASPHVEPATHGQATAKAPARGRPTAARASLQGRLTPLAGVATSKGGRRHSRGQPPAGTPACSAAPAKEAGCRVLTRGCSQKGWRCRPQGWPPLGRVAAGGLRQLSPGQGQQRRRRWGKSG